MFLVDWPGGDWQATLKLALIIIFVYIAVLWLTLVFWAFRDIRQRTRDPIVQMVAVLLVALFFLPGHWIYLIVRPRYTLSELYERSLEEEALLQDLEDQKACPTCKRRIQDDFLVCPSCRTQLKEPCRSCAKPLSYAWVACPFCGLEKAPREGFGPRASRSGMKSSAPPARPRQASQPAAASAPVAAVRSAPGHDRSAPGRDPFAARAVPPLVLEEEGPVIGESAQ